MKFSVYWIYEDEQVLYMEEHIQRIYCSSGFSIQRVYPTGAWFTSQQQNQHGAVVALQSMGLGCWRVASDSHGTFAHK